MFYSLTRRVMLLLTVILSGGVLFLCKGQPGYTQIWYFGTTTGMDFTGGAPVGLTNGQLNTQEGSTAVCDSLSGNLLFYSDGISVYNSNHQLMPSGTGLNGAFSSTTSALAFPNPGGDGRYYLFSTPRYVNVANADSMYYSIIDMNQDGGLGDVVVKNRGLFLGSTERMAATFHCNGRDVWLVGQHLAFPQFYAYQISTSGISSPVVTTIGSLPGDGIGQMKISPNGDYLAFVDHSSGAVWLFDFDISSGNVSNPNQLTKSLGTGYGLAFSHDSQKLYAMIGPNYTELYQWDLSTGIPANIASSFTLVGFYTGSFGGGMQLAPDNKIYISLNNHTFLGVIHNPTVAGIGCNFSTNGVSLNGGFANLGLPAYNDGVFNPGGPGCGALPVVLTAFEAQARRNGTVQLSWTAADETGFSHYAIERSLNGTDFSQLGTVQGSEKSTGALQYSFTDFQPETGLNYYRLKMVDLDGAYDYSKLKWVNTDATGFPELTIAPNPASGLTRLYCEACENESWTLVNVLGERVMKGMMENGSGTVSLEGIVPGIYFIRLESQRGVLTKRLLVQ